MLLGIYYLYFHCPLCLLLRLIPGRKRTGPALPLALGSGSFTQTQTLSGPEGEEERALRFENHFRPRPEAETPQAFQGRGRTLNEPLGGVPSETSQASVQPGALSPDNNNNNNKVPGPGLDTRPDPESNLTPTPPNGAPSLLENLRQNSQDFGRSGRILPSQAGHRSFTPGPAPVPEVAPVPSEMETMIHLLNEARGNPQRLEEMQRQLDNLVEQAANVQRTTQQIGGNMGQQVQSMDLLLASLVRLQHQVQARPWLGALAAGALVVLNHRVLGWEWLRPLWNILTGGARRAVQGLAPAAPAPLDPGQVLNHVNRDHILGLGGGMVFAGARHWLREMLRALQQMPRFR
jgi:hypothetical protein